jgi:hypothetical protein
MVLKYDGACTVGLARFAAGDSQPEAPSFVKAGRTAYSLANERESGRRFSFFIFSFGVGGLLINKLSFC